jgi:hypothetical protein
LCERGAVRPQVVSELLGCRDDFGRRALQLEQLIGIDRTERVSMANTLLTGVIDCRERTLHRRRRREVDKVARRDAAPARTARRRPLTVGVGSLSERGLGPGHVV